MDQPGGFTVFHFVRTIRHLPLAAVLAALPCAPAAAATLFTAVLDGDTANTASFATGMATLTLNDAETEVAFHIEYTGLDGVEGPSHFHRGVPGTDGPVLFTLPSGSPKDGVWPVSPTEVSYLFGDAVYINVHTDVYPGGEIRGNVSFQSVPAEPASWSAVKALFR